MSIFRKLILATFGLSFAFVISSCKDPNVLSSKIQINPYPVSVEPEHEEQKIKEKQERHHRRW